MATEKQIKLFHKIGVEKQLPAGTELPKLEEIFAELSRENASEWIERMMELPNKGKSEDGTDKPHVAPTF